VVDKDSKAFNPLPVFPCKMSWDFSRKIKCNDAIKNWKMTFQALDLKGSQFLDLLDDYFNNIELSYVKRESWLEKFEHFFICMCYKSNNKSCSDW